MQADNDFFGHTAILARYAGFDDQVPPIWGYLQHGYNRGTGFPDAYKLRSWLPKFVWNMENASEARRRGIRSVHVIGSPFVYLDRKIRGGTQAVPPLPETPRTLVYPFHVADHESLDADHDRYIDSIRSHE